MQDRDAAGKEHAEEGNRSAAKPAPGVERPGVG